MELRVDKNHIITIHESIYYVLCNGGIRLLCNNLFVFGKYLIGYAQYILPFV